MYSQDLMRYPGGSRCCICFEGFKKAELYEDPDGDVWDICVGCQALESPTTTTWPG